MVREDLLGALKNAIERGESEEEAKQSLLNSSYPEEEIREAINLLRSYQKEVKAPETPRKKALPLKENFIKDIKNILSLKSQKIKEIPLPQQPGKKKNNILKYFLIGAGALVLIVIIIFILLLTRVIKT